ncbi:hypothetical protein ANCCEY_00429 [Ancylostoma ceylanicum]|uniref:Uncharacterized protein n=1 Tax=Ancylostoma ceylanicum TaxID=53326 RepID=A0A0D6MDE7_9BILA|nr:hypothetical protein ANCCEY_00429 [Ancylostoma ceylanicum]
MSMTMPEMLLLSFYLFIDSSSFQSMDPLSAAEHANGRPASWVGFDEISMTSPVNGRTTASGQPQGARPGSVDPYDGRNSVAAEERLELEDNERTVVTPLPTKEVIADPSSLGQAPVVDASQEYHEKRPVIMTRDVDPIRGFQTPGGIHLVNSKIIATVYPENTMCSWVIPPRYDPYSIPSILAAEGFTMPAEDYVTAMELITNDYRFRSFSSLYSRLVAFWMTLSIVILLVVLFANSEGGILVMSFCLFWCVMLFAGIIACAIIRKQIRIGLRHCVQSANKVLIKNNMLAGVEDKGQLSCHKVVIHMMWFRLEDCFPDIERLIRIEASGGAVVFGGGAHTAPAKEMTKKEIEEKARHLILKYSQEYVKDTARYRLIFPSRPSLGVSDYAPKHCPKQLCLCQYIDKNHFNRPPRKWYSHFV